MVRKGKTFEVDTSPTKDVVVSGLTRDATVEACLFDLIDNALDAARETSFQAQPAEARDVLPESYQGYRVSLTLSGAGLKISDNCGGIPVDRLKNMVMRFGRRSNREMGIGVFGVGLNRALFKLGKVAHLTTDTGRQRAALVLKTDDYLRSPSWALPAEEFNSHGKVGTEVEITQLSADISSQFADGDWIDNLRREAGTRYGRFVSKGFAITVNDVEIADREILIREDGPYPGEYKIYKTEEGVSIHLRYGQHLRHRFAQESDYDRSVNVELSSDFGWTILCNDRAILIADRSDKTGWDKKFHTEHNGFVGIASFVGPEPALLPWNTTKTDVDLNNRAYRMALSDMRYFILKWRKTAELRKKDGGPPKPLPQRQMTSLGPQPDTTMEKPGAAAKAPKTVVPTQTVATRMPIVKPDSNMFRTILPQDIDERHCVDKHLVLVHEAKRLDLVDYTYTGLALMRMLFEVSVAAHLHRHDKYLELRSAAVERRRARGMTISSADEKSVHPSIDEVLPYLDKHPEVWGAKTTQLKHCLKRMSAHQQTMNGVLHNFVQTLHPQRAFEIRDEVLPLLRQLIEE